MTLFLYIFFVSQSGTSGPSRKPLKCRVMHHKVIAHQIFAVQMLGWLNKIAVHSGLYFSLPKLCFEFQGMYKVEDFLLTSWRTRQTWGSKM